jgi:hypothetical protein
MMAYTYDPLAAPEDEIRVALLQPGIQDDEIRVTFRRRLLEVGELFTLRLSVEIVTMLYERTLHEITSALSARN